MSEPVITSDLPIAEHGGEWRQLARALLHIEDADAKARLAQALYEGRHQLTLDADATLAPPQPDTPTMPRGLQLAPHTEVARRSPATLHGRAVLVHAIVHIEYNAIHLALDAVWRFAGMPQAYYEDWLRIAAEEGRHFQMLRAQLRAMGYDYGDFPAHQGLWTMCEKTSGDIVARMALVPRTLEARGLDATPLIQQKLAHVDTEDARAISAILDVILEEEVGHVAIGNHWYRWLCAQRGLDAEALYPQLVARYEAPRPKPPLNLAARRQAGFSEAELDYLEWGG
ncbi:ferritin-like domain-containing protein [Lampropedia cohaerens]|uniref:ferritin-like domain-containing protein n=1 Tax=Lampropedia cohaerens TaxID=1610491 RepID=UPI000A07D3C9|nr:ferritin-like domain-containing protein [Lampropedia cohaerens]